MQSINWLTLKQKKAKKRPEDELARGRLVFWIERNFADWYQLTIWPNMLTQEHLLYKQPICSARNQNYFQMDALGYKATRDNSKIKHVFCFFSCKKSHHYKICKYLNSHVFPLPMRKISFLNTIESVRRKKTDKYDHYISSFSRKFHKDLWNWLVLAMISTIWKIWIYQS